MIARIRQIGTFALALILALPAAGETVVRMAINTLPPFEGAPFATSATPTITTIGAIYEGLTRIGSDGSLKPWLAESWETVDRHTWRFHLKPGVTFSNGAPFNAAAVAFTVDYLSFTATLATDRLIIDLPKLDGAQVVDDLTVDIRTTDEIPTFPRYATALLIPEPGAYQALGREAFQKQPVGTGPFVIERWQPDRAIFRAFAGSWRKPKADRLEIIELPETTSRVQAILSDQADIATGLTADDLGVIESAGHQGFSWRDAQVSSISLVATRALPFNDVRVRQALNLAVDRQQIIDVLLGGATVPAGQPAAAGVLGHDPAIPLFPYDPARAKALLAEAGYPDGFSFVYETTGAGGQLSVYQQVAADLAAIGVNMEIRALPGPQYLRNIFQSGEYADAISVPWLAAPTQDVMRPVLIHSCNARFPWFCERDLMPKIQAAQSEWDETRALELRRELGRIYHDRAAALFLYETPLFVGLRKGVGGYQDIAGFVTYEDLMTGQGN